MVLADWGEVRFFNHDSGGWWLHLVLRVRGVRRGGYASIELRERDLDGPVLGQRSWRTLQLYPPPDGWFQGMVRLAVFRDLGEGGDMGRLGKARTGQPGYLRLTYDLVARSASASTAVVFAGF